MPSLLALDQQTFDVGFPFVGHLQQNAGGPLVRERSGEAAALLNSLPHAFYRVEIGHAD